MNFFEKSENFQKTKDKNFEKKENLQKK